MFVTTTVTDTQVISVGSPGPEGPPGPPGPPETHTHPEYMPVDGGTATNIQSLTFDQITTELDAVGKLKWNDTDGTLDLGLKGGQVTLQIGQENVIRVLNNSGSPMVDPQVVYATGSQGQRIAVALAQASTEPLSSKTLAVLTEPIANNQQGFGTTHGLVRNIDTSSLTEGAAVWLSTSVAGGLTSTRPTAPNHAVFIGWCIHQHNTQGAIFVHIQNGYELDELHDVFINSIQNNQILQWNATNSRWENKTDLNLEGFLDLPKVQGKGITLKGTYGWADLIGDIAPKTIGAGAPTLTTYRNNVRWFAYAATEDGDIIFHIPHDYAVGTDMFLHAHWSHIGTAISGTLDIRFHVSYAKGHGQAVFPADTEFHIISNPNITDDPQYCHCIEEVPLTTAGGSATTIDTSLIEPDGIMMIHYDFDTIPTITGGTSNKVFLLAVDIHYQTTGIPTKNKSPNFWA